MEDSLIFGVIPQKPLAIVIVSGLLVATQLKLIVLPVMYKLFTPNR